MWWMLIPAAISAVQSMSANNAANKAAAKQSITYNNAVIKSNVQNSIRTAYRVGLLNMQQGLLKKQATQQGFDTTVQAGKVMGAATASAAASGTIGASVDAVSQDISMKLGEAKAQQAENWEVSLTNFNTQLHSLVQQGIDAVNDAGDVNLKSQGSIVGEGLMAGAASFASSYFGSNMGIGLGSSTGASTSTAMGSLGYGVSSAGSSIGANTSGNVDFTNMGINQWLRG